MYKGTILSLSVMYTFMPFIKVEEDINLGIVFLSKSFVAIDEEKKHCDLNGD